MPVPCRVGFVMFHHLVPRTLSLLPFRSYVTNATQRTSYDIVVVGGGMVGFGLAALAAASPLLSNKRILLLEGSPLKPYQAKEAFESRTVALNCASLQMLTKLGAWRFIQSKRAQPVKKMKVWEDQCDAFLTFERDPLAYVVENSLVVESLRRAAVENSDNLTVMYDTQARNIQLPSVDQLDQLVQLEAHVLNSSDPPLFLETSLLVGADGIRSTVREVAGLKTISWDHGQSAVVATLCMGQNHEPFTAWQRFLTTGPIAVLPLSDKHSCLIWSTTSAEAERLTSLNDAEFVWEVNNALTRPNPPPTGEMLALSRLGKALATAVDYSLGKSSPLTESAPIPPQVEGIQPNTIRARYPLGFQHADFYHAPRVALAGDAAHRILPLAGQGVNLGFGDLMSLIRCLEDAVSQGADIASLPHLQDYTADRQRAVAVIAVTLEVLNALYSRDAVYSKVFGTFNNLGAYEDSPLLRLANRLVVGIRGAGVSAIQSSALAKNFLMQVAVHGQFGFVDPELCR